MFVVFFFFLHCIKIVDGVQDTMLIGPLFWMVAAIRHQHFFPVGMGQKWGSPPLRKMWTSPGRDIHWYQFHFLVQCFLRAHFLNKLLHLLVRMLLPFMM